MPWECYFATETERCWQYLRRYHSQRDDCPLPHKYHDAMVEIEQGKIVYDDKYPVVREHRFVSGCTAMNTPRSDPRWPTKCACGYQFTEQDEWQVFQDQIFEIQGVGDVSIHGGDWARPRMKIGTLYDCWWIGDSPRFSRGPDGYVLACILPDYRTWIIDGPSKQHPDHPAWSRTGTVPKITCSPSIDSGSYHGFLQNGILTDGLTGQPGY